MIPSAPTLHVVGTEMVVGAFALSGLCFLFCFLSTFEFMKFAQMWKQWDTLAHGSLMFGLLATPLAIISGIASSPGEDIQSALLANKLSLSMSGIGFALAVLVVRFRGGFEVWNQRKSALLHSMVGMTAVGLMLLTASLGGRFSRGESLLDFAHLPYDTVFIAPVWFSLFLMVLGLSNIVVYLKKHSAVEH